MLETITLDAWVKAGGNMLSTMTAAWCCQVARINERQLRAMPLKDIFNIGIGTENRPGIVAQREVNRFYDSRNVKL